MSTKKNPVTAYLAKIGARGGRVTGPSKARSSAQARAAVNARWAKHKQKGKK